MADKIMKILADVTGGKKEQAGCNDGRSAFDIFFG